MHPKYQQADLAMSDIHASQQAFRRHAWKRDCVAESFSSAKLIDGTRPRVLALKTTRSPTCSPFFVFFVYFVVFNPFWLCFFLCVLCVLWFLKSHMQSCGSAATAPHRRRYA